MRAPRLQPPNKGYGLTEEADEGGGRARGQTKRVGEQKEEVGGRAGERANGRVEEMSGHQGGVTGPTKELGRLGSLEDSGGLACPIGATILS